MNEILCISIRILLKFVVKGPIDNKSALVQVMVWHRTDDIPFLEPMITQFIQMTQFSHKWFRQQQHIFQNYVTI